MCRDCERRRRRRKVKINKTKVFYENDEFVVPRGVDKVSVTLLGGGGAGGAANDLLGAGGGGSGYLVSDYVLNVNHCDTLDITVGNGGKAVESADGQDGDDSVVKYNDITIKAFGGKGGRTGIFPPEPAEGGRGGDGYYGGGGGINSRQNPNPIQGQGGKGIAPSFNGNDAGDLPTSGDGSSGGKGIEGGGGGGPGGGNGGGNDGSGVVAAQNGTNGLGSGGGGAGLFRTNPSDLNNGGNGGNGGSGYVKIQYTKTKYY